jgi:hypothetical protein
VQSIPGVRRRKDDRRRHASGSQLARRF